MRRATVLAFGVEAVVRTALVTTSNEHSEIFRMMTKGDFLMCFVASLTRAKKMATNINATEHNTLPVLYNINSSKVIISQHQHYIYLYALLFTYI